MYNFFKNIFRKVKTVDDLVKYEKNIHNIAWWIESNIFYVSSPDHYASAEEVLKKRQGNCFGMANLFSECIKKLDFEPHLVEVERKDGKHHICVFKSGDRWMYFSNGVLHYPSRWVKSVEDVAKFYDPKLVSFRETDSEGHNATS